MKKKIVYIYQYKIRIKYMTLFISQESQIRLKYSANAICNAALLFANAKSNERKRIKKKRGKEKRTALSQPKVRPIPKLCEHIFGLALGRTGCADGAV